MALTKTQICNLALSKLGSERLQLASFDSDTGVIKDQVDLHYTPTLEELTRMHSWNCCKKKTELSPYILNFTGLDDGVELFNYDVIAEENTITTSDSTIDVSKWQSPKYVVTRNTSGSNPVMYGITLERDLGSVAFGAGGLGWWHLVVTDPNEAVNNLETKTYATYGAVPVFSETASFTGKTGTMSVEVTRPAPTEYDYQYFIPADAQRSFYLTNTSDSYRFMKPRVDWVIEGNKILTNEKKVYLCYDGVPEPSAMDSLFAQAFVTLLASRLAVPMTGDRKLSLSLLEEFNRVIMPEARRVNGAERLDPPTVDSEWLESTYTSTSSYSNSYPPFSQTSYGSFS
jgi:hypothetical protein